MRGNDIIETLHHIQPDGSVLYGKLVYDECGFDIDDPKDDHSGEDAWEWIQWDNSNQRNDWVAEHFDCVNCCEPPHEGDTCPAWDEPTACELPSEYAPFNPATDFWIERYEHSLVRYAPSGESSQIDRQWDVAGGVAIMRFTKPETIGPDDDPDKLLNFARGVCDEYTMWCNGEIYGIVVERFPTIAHYETAMLDGDDGEHEDSIWGIIGYDYAVEELNSMVGKERQPA